jgi:large subunit ribosomal protein L15
LLSRSASSVIDPKNAHLVRLNALKPALGSQKKRVRVGRGIGSGRGKTSTRGHKGQKARNMPPIWYEGGQTPLHRRTRKFGFKNPFSKDYEVFNLVKLQQYVEEGRINPNNIINMKTLRDAGMFKRIKQGVKLLARGKEDFRLQVPLHLEVTEVSKAAKEVIEKAGGTVKTVYFNRLGLRTFLLNEPQDITIRFAAAPRKHEKRFDVPRYQLPSSSGAYSSASTVPSSPQPSASS